MTACNLPSPDQHEPKPARRSARGVWQWLIEPADSIKEVGARQQARLLSILLLTVIPLAALATFTTKVVSPIPAIPILLASTAVLLTTAYGLSRTEHYGVAAVIVVATISSVPFAHVFLVADYSPYHILTAFIWTAISVLLGSLLFSIRSTLILACANLLGLILLPVLIPNVAWQNIVLPLGFIAVTSALALGAKQHRNLLEKDRLAELTSTSRELQAIRASLEQRVAERTAALQASEAELRALFEAMTDVIVVLDAEGHYLKVPPTNPSLLYRPAAELLGKKMHQVLPPAQADALFACIRRALETHQTVNAEYSLDIGGKGTWFAAAISPLQEDRVILVARDITERKQAEAALQASEERFRILFENSPDAVVLVDPHHPITPWAIVDCNDNFCRMNGYSRKELIGQPIDIVNTADFSPEAHAAYLDQLRREGTRNVEVQHRRKDGTLVSIETSTSVVTFAGRELVLGIDRDITERKRAEETLRESEERFRSILDNIEDGYYEVDTAGNFTFFNPALVRMLGRPANELMGMNNRLYMTPEGGKAVFQTFNRVFRTRIPEQALDWDLVRPDGTLQSVEVSVSLIKAADGSIEGFRGTVRDITERKQMQEALMQERNMLRTLIDSLPDYIYIKDTAGRYLISNTSHIRFLGATTLDQVVGKTAFGFFPKELAAQYDADDRTVIQSGHPVINREEPTVDRDGNRGWNSTTKVPLRDIQGKIVGLVGISRDITKRKRTEEALARERNLLRSLIDNVPDYIYVKDTESRFLMANPAVARLMGAATPDELLGKTDFDLFPQELAAKYYADEQAIFQSGQPLLECEEPTVDTAGNPRWVSTTKVPLRDAQGKIFGLVGMGREITERKQAEAALARERTLLNTLMDNIPDYIYFKDAQSRFIRTTRAHAKAFGLSDPAEAVGKTDFDFFAEEHARQAYEDEQRIIRTGQPIVGVVERETWPDRPDTWVSTTKLPLRDEKGNIVGTFGISRDITQLRQTEDALRESEKRYHRQATHLQMAAEVGQAVTSILDLNQVLPRVVDLIRDRFEYYHAGIFLTDDTGTKTVLRAASGPWGQRLLAAESPTLPIGGKSIIGLVSKTGKPYVAQDVTADPLFLYEPSLSETKSEAAIPLPIGDTVIGVLDVQSKEVNAFSPDTISILTTMADQIAVAVQNARLYEDARQHLEEISVLNEIGQAISSALELEPLLQVIHTQVGRLMDNRNFYIAVYNEAEDEVSFPLYAGEDAAARRGLKRKSGKGLTEYLIRTRQPLLIRRDLPAHLEQIGIHLLGRNARSWLGVPLSLEERVIGAMSVQSYEQEEVYDEEDLRIFTAIASQAAVAIEKARLHTAVQERARELEQAYRQLQENQEKLLISEKMASLGRLTAGIAHEMNTPLATVRAALTELGRLLEDYQSSTDNPETTPDDKMEIAQEMKRSIQLANNAAGRTASFVRGIKVQTRSLTPQERVRFNAVPVIGETLLLLNHALRKGDCTINFETMTDYLELYGSPAQLSQVVTNLISNSIDACIAKGGGPITLRLTPSDNGVELQVSDAGCGIPPEIIPKIFDPMFTTKPFGQGTGLGLTIVHDIVTGEFGGSIDVSSQPGQGTTFTIHFPSPKEA